MAAIAAQAVQDNFFIPVIDRICETAREPLTNLSAWLQKGTPVRYIDGDEKAACPSCYTSLVQS